MKLAPMILMIAAVAVAGCSSDDDALETTVTETEVVTGPAPNTVEYFRQVVGDRVFFDTDRYNIDTTSQITLDGQAQWLVSNGATTVTVEGHTDERGTRAYNLALGARRANSVKNYLVSKGVDAGRIRTVSYGKERPIALGSDPQSWAQNRRAVSVVIGAPGS